MVLFRESTMPRFTVFRAKRSDLDKLRDAVGLAHRRADESAVGLTYFVPDISDVRNSNLAKVVSDETMRDLTKRRLRLASGEFVKLVSLVTSRFETGVMLALWTAPEQMMSLESCSMATDIIVVTGDEEDLDAWLATTAAEVF
jgi:hypothetical protein